MNDIIGEIHRIRERQAAGRKLNAMSLGLAENIREVSSLREPLSVYEAKAHAKPD